METYLDLVREVAKRTHAKCDDSCRVENHRLDAVITMGELIADPELLNQLVVSAPIIRGEF